MSREYKLFLEDMRRACEKVIQFTKGLTLTQFLADEKTSDAAMRNLEIIGEAAKHIADEVRKQYPDINWRKIAGFRDVSIHEYFGIDADVVWDIITKEIPVLRTKLQRIIKP